MAIIAPFDFGDTYMTEQERRDELVRRLEAAGSAHGEYETKSLNGVYDQQWADWYAQYLIENGWNDQFSQKWTAPQLAEALRQADTNHRTDPSKPAWSKFYAARFATS